MVLTSIFPQRLPFFTVTSLNEHGIERLFHPNFIREKLSFLIFTMEETKIKFEWFFKDENRKGYRYISP